MAGSVVPPFPQPSTRRSPMQLHCLHRAKNVGVRNSAAAWPRASMFACTNGTQSSATRTFTGERFARVQSLRIAPAYAQPNRCTLLVPNRIGSRSCVVCLSAVATPLSCHRPLQLLQLRVECEILVGHLHLFLVTVLSFSPRLFSLAQFTVFTHKRSTIG